MLKVSMNVRGSSYCCGLQELGSFHTQYAPGHVLTPEEKKQFEIYIRERPATFCTTVKAYRERSYNEETDEYEAGDLIDPEDSQGTLNQLLPQLGFKPVGEFEGNEGNTVQLWLYVRDDKRI